MQIWFNSLASCVWASLEYSLQKPPKEARNRWLPHSNWQSIRILERPQKLFLVVHWFLIEGWLSSLLRGIQFCIISHSSQYRFVQVRTCTYTIQVDSVDWFGYSGLTTTESCLRVPCIRWRGYWNHWAASSVLGPISFTDLERYLLSISSLFSS